MLVQVAWAAVHAKATIFRERYGRWSKRMGKKKALVAVGHRILSLIHLLLKNELDHQELTWCRRRPDDRKGIRKDRCKELGSTPSGKGRLECIA